VLTEEDLKDIEVLFLENIVVGERYAGNHNTFHEN
jgi:hypothetical protein